MEESRIKAEEKFNKTGKEVKNINASVNQYKVGVVALDNFINKDFSGITAKELEQLDEIRDGKNINHVRGFLITCISQDWIEVDPEIIIYLIPKELRKVASKLLII